MTPLHLWLDHYDDLYSDFDPRHYAKRRISEDFLHELREAWNHHEVKGNELVLLLPEKTRSKSVEKAVPESLSRFFNQQYNAQRKTLRNKRRQGILLGLAGVLIMTANVWAGYSSRDSVAVSILKVLLEPAGWFFLWVSFDFLFYDLRSIRKELKFLQAMTYMKIEFRSIGAEP